MIKKEERADVTKGRQPALHFALCFLLFAVATPSLANEKCAYPDIFSTLLTKPENQLGEFRISLAPPDYSDVQSIQQHLLFSGTLGRLLRNELRLRTRGRCGAVTSSDLFPDIWAFLSVGRPSGDADSDRTQCVTALSNILSELEPTQEDIKRAGREEGDALVQLSSRPRGQKINPTSILANSLFYIYGSGTVMHSLVSPDIDSSTIDAGTFPGWLKEQQSSGRSRLSEIRLCPSSTAPQQQFETAGSEPFPFSVTIPPGPLKLSMKAGADLPNALRHVVILGLNAPVSSLSGLNTLVSIPAMTKYCNRETSFSEAGNSGVTVRVRCLSEIRYSKNWLMFFCDLNDCHSERMAAQVAGTIVIDPDVLSLARANTENGYVKGPYLVSTMPK